MTHSKNVIPVDDARFEAEVLRAEVPVMVDFSTKWCGPCKALRPIVDRIADENVGRLKVISVDIDDAPGAFTRYGVRASPTVMVFVGGEVRGQHTGLTSRERLLGMLGG